MNAATRYVVDECIDDLLRSGQATGVLVLILDDDRCMHALSKALVDDAEAHAWVLGVMRALEQPARMGQEKETER